MGFEVDNRLIKLAARTLNPPSLMFKKNKAQIDSVNSKDAFWSLAYPEWKGAERVFTPRTFFSAAKPNISLNLWFLQSERRDTPESFKRSFTAHGLHISKDGNINCKERVDKRSREALLDAWFREKNSNTQHQNEENTNVCSLIVLEQKDFDAYSTIKWKADIEYGRHTLCMLAKNFGDTRSVPSNLALKVNMKFGGQSHHLNGIPHQLTNPDNVIVLGADVAHPGAGARPGSPSIACVVGSVDNHFVDYPGSMRLQAGGQEVSECLNNLCIED